MYHLVSAIDPIVESDITHPIHDGLPETFPQWIHYNGLTHFKIKLDGETCNWDTATGAGAWTGWSRRPSADGAARMALFARFQRALSERRVPDRVLKTVKEKSPEGFARIQYVEQPTARDLDTHRKRNVRGSKTETDSYR